MYVTRFVIVSNLFSFLYMLFTAYMCIQLYSGITNIAYIAVASINLDKWPTTNVKTVMIKNLPYCLHLRNVNSDVGSKEELQYCR